MKSRFNWAVALFLLSFALPVVDLAGPGLNTIYGWEAMWEVMNTWSYDDMDLVDNDLWRSLQYFLVNLANPLALVVIILHYAKVNKPFLIWLLSLSAVISALLWSPYFVGNILTYFSMGYWSWLIGIILIHFYANEGTFKRPKKNA